MIEFMSYKMSKTIDKELPGEEEVPDASTVEIPEYEDTDIEKFATSFDIAGNAKVDVRNAKFKTVIEHLSCPICQQPFCDPITTRCGHTFCRYCIFECLKTSNEDQISNRGVCPLDRTLLNAADPNDLFPSTLLIKNMVDDLEVFCLNEERGCEWIGHRWELEHHVLVECEYTGVQCKGKRIARTVPATTKPCAIIDVTSEENCLEPSNENTKDAGQPSTERDSSKEMPLLLASGTDDAECDLLLEGYEQTNGVSAKYEVCELFIQRRFYKQSPSTCAHRLYPCKYCGKKISLISEENHLLKECVLNFRTCDLCLNDMIPMKNLRKHEENCSNIKHIRCPAHTIGCKWIGKTEPALEIHLQNNGCQLYQLLPFITNMSSRVESLERENIFLQKQINKILSLVTLGKVTNLGYSEPLEEIDTSSTSRLTQDRLVYLNYELERIRIEVEEKIIPCINKNNTSSKELQNVVSGLMNDNFMMKDDLNLQRVLLNNIRKQFQYLHFTRNLRLPPSLSSMAAGSIIDNDEGLDISSRNNSEERLNLKL